MPSVQVGADTMLTCNFTNTLNADKPDVLVKHKAFNSSEWTDVLDCYRNHEDYTCDIYDPKFVLISGPSESIVLGLTNSTKASQGTYKCFCLPETDGAYQPCTFMLDPTPPSTLTINPTALTLTPAEEFNVGTVTAPEEGVQGQGGTTSEETEKAERAEDNSVTIIVVSLGVVAVAIGAVLAFWYYHHKGKASAQGQSTQAGAAGAVGNLDAAAATPPKNDAENTASKASSLFFDNSSVAQSSDPTDDSTVEGSDANSELP